MLTDSEDSYITHAKCYVTVIPNMWTLFYLAFSSKHAAWVWTYYLKVTQWLER